MPQIAIYCYNIVYDTSSMSQMLEQQRHPKPMKTLVERLPVKEGTKLSESTNYSWKDLQGLTWVFSEDWS